MGFLERFLRPCRKLTDMFLIACVETFALVLIGGILGNIIVEKTHGVDIGVDVTQLAQLMQDQSQTGTAGGIPAHLACAAHYLTFCGIWVFTLLAMVIPPSNRPMLRKFLISRDGNSIKRILLGLLAGFGINSICVIISIFLGDIALSFDHFGPLPLLILFLAVLVQSGAEEITCRLFLFQKLSRRFRSPLVAVIISSVFFAASHLANPGIGPVPIAQLIVVATLFAILIYYYDALGACITFHTAWNFTQNIIYGLPNSGLVSLYSIFKLEAASSGPFFDATFGVEGGVGGTVLLVLACVFLVVHAKRNGYCPKDLWEDGATLEEPQLAPASTGPRHMA